MSDQKQTKENETMNAAQVLVRCLENEGVEYVFGIPGEENLEVMRALKDSKIKFITVRHEQGAAFMADVYGKLKGKAGVCLATLGPGATNLVTGVADANTDGAPLIAITGQVGTERMHLTSHQYLDLVTMFTPITKRSKQVVNPDTVNEVVRIAFKYAESEKPGACHIDLPCNIAAMPVESEVGRQPLKHHKPNLEMASIESLEEAAGLLFQAKRPVILARPCHINKLYQPDVEVIGDLSYSLNHIAMRCHRNEEPEWAFKLRDEMRKEHEAYAKDMEFPMKPQKILNDVRKVMGKEDIVISDVGAHKMWIARHYNCYEPNTCIISNGFATMGIAVPGALAAKLINLDKKVLAITGDGGFMMNCQEFETALRTGTPFVTLVFNDCSYGLIKWKEEDRYGENFYVDFTNPDFVKFAESMHAIGYRINSAEELIPTLEKAFEQKVPVIIDCPVDYRENTKLTEHLKELINSYQAQQPEA